MGSSSKRGTCASTKDPFEPKILSELIDILKEKKKVSWSELSPVHRAYLISKNLKKDIIELQDIHDLIDSNKFDGIPPCIRRAVTKKDMDVLDEIFSYFHTYGCEKMEPVLWSIGYFSFNNYAQKKLSAMAMVKGARHFPCTPIERPPNLSKYCPGKCLLQDPKFRLDLMIEEVTLDRSELPLSANITIKLKDGSVFKIDNMTFIPTNTAPFFLTVARQFLKWYPMTHHGVNYPDFIDMDERSLASYLKHRVYGGAEDEAGVASMCGGNP